jgi:hypothetical protein
VHTEKIFTCATRAHLRAAANEVTAIIVKQRNTGHGFDDACQAKMFELMFPYMVEAVMNEPTAETPEHIAMPDYKPQL